MPYWLEEQPGHTQALFLRARVWRARQKLADAAVDYRRVIELDPQRQDARWELGLCLVENHDYAEALPLVEEVRRFRPTDPEVDVELALCQEGLGHSDAACALLDQVLRERPGMAPIAGAGPVALQAGQLRRPNAGSGRLVAAPYDLHTNMLADTARQERRSGSNKHALVQIKQCISRLREICGRCRSVRTIPRCNAKLAFWKLGSGVLSAGTIGCCWP